MRRHLVTAVACLRMLSFPANARLHTANAGRFARLLFMKRLIQEQLKKMVVLTELLLKGTVY